MDLVFIQFGIEMIWQLVENLILPVSLLFTLSPLYFLLKRTRDRSWGINVLFYVLAGFIAFFLVPWILCNPSAPECLPFLRLFITFVFAIYFFTSIGLFFGVVVLHKKKREDC